MTEKGEAMREDSVKASAFFFPTRGDQGQCSVTLCSRLQLCGDFKYFLFSPLFGEDSEFDEHIFQLGWFNHQLDSMSKEYSFDDTKHLRFEVGENKDPRSKLL